MQTLDGRGGMRAPTRTPQRLKIVDTSASSEKGEDDNSDNVMSDNRDETWQSGRPAPGYIDLDLGAGGAVIEHLDLLPYQVPTPAATHHRIWVGDTLEDMRLVTEVKQQTTHHQWVSKVPVGEAARFVRVETVDHPGWVAWSGIKVFGTHAAQADA